MAKTRAPLSAITVLRKLEPGYPPLATPLNYNNPWELLVAVILSAQCTDARVNLVTPELFAKLPGAAAMAKAPILTIEKLIHSTGFYKSKAKNLKACAQAVLNNHSGSIPESMRELIALPGVGRKTANVVQQVIHGRVEGIVVDTHIFRVSWRTGAATKSTPQQVERELMETLPKSKWQRYGEVAIQHGRVVCHARKPDCVNCPLMKTCPSSIA